MKTLDEIAIECGTDKASVHPYKGHDYARHYDDIFTPIRQKPIKLLEIGVGGGESILTWLSYFPNARVYGVDNVKDTNDWNTPGAPTHKRYTSVYGDQSDPVFWKCFVADYGTGWNIIVDDGGHFINQIVATFNGMWAYMPSGGLYCIEDLGVAYGAGSIFIPAGHENHIQFLSHRMDDINLDEGAIESLTLWKELAVLRKK